MARQLEDLGHKQEETTVITKILHSLPATFHPMISAWDSVPKEEQTLAKLLPRLIKEELAQSFSELKVSDNEVSAILYAKKSKYNKNLKQDKKSSKESALTATKKSTRLDNARSLNEK